MRTWLVPGALALCLLTHPAFATEDAVVRGQIVARDRLALSSQLNAIVSALRVREGDSFQTGAPLVDMDCRSYRAQLAQARAAERLAQAVLRNTQNLARMESASVQEVEKAQAEVDINAQARALAQLDVERCTVRAPFTGAVVSLAVGRGEFVNSGKPLMEIVSTEGLEAHFLLPSTAIREVRAGQAFSINVHETGAAVNGVIRQIAPIADPLNRTIKVFGTLTNPPALVRPGMSGNVTLGK